MEDKFTQYEDHLAKFIEAVHSNSYAHAEYMYGVPVEPEGYSEYKRKKEIQKQSSSEEDKFRHYEDHVRMFTEAVNSNSYAHAEYMYGVPVKPTGYDEWAKNKK